MFKLYAVPDPDDTERMIFTFKECRNFIAGVTGGDCELSDWRIDEILKFCGEGSFNKLDLEHFIKYYTKCCIDNVEQVRRNFVSYGLQSNLKFAPEDG